MHQDFLSSTFSSLQSRNFRNFWLGQCISVIGTWVQRTAQTWLVYKMTNSALLVGILSACQFVPILLLTLFAGTIIDRFSKKKILLITQSGFLLLGLLMTGLVFFNLIQYWEILLIAISYGVIQSFDTPTRQSFVYELVGPKNLLNGISLNSSVFNLAKIIGPSIAGILMANFSLAICFFIDACSYSAVLIGLLFIDNFPALAPTTSKQLLKNVQTGVKYILKNNSIKLSAELMLIICTLNFNNNVIIPVYAKTVLHSGAQTFANLLSAVGIGSLIAAFIMSYLAKNGKNQKLYLLVIIGSILSQSLMIFIHNYAIALLMMGIIGFCNMIFLNQSNAAFQYAVPNELRGRIMSVYVLLNQGTTPIGSLYAGSLMDLTSGLWGFPGCGFFAGILLIPVILRHKALLKEWLKN
ncbi:MAG: MFS transporter [Liquorilactobacillus nagelii]